MYDENLDTPLFSMRQSQKNIFTLVCSLLLDNFLFSEDRIDQVLYTMKSFVAFESASPVKHRYSFKIFRIVRNKLQYVGT